MRSFWFCFDCWLWFNGRLGIGKVPATQQRHTINGGDVIRTATATARFSGKLCTSLQCSAWLLYIQQTKYLRRSEGDMPIRFGVQY